jgi:hypothetical protein
MRLRWAERLASTAFGENELKITFIHFTSLAEVAQLVEHFPEEEGVTGSNPVLGTKRV